VTRAEIEARLEAISPGGFFADHKRVEILTTELRALCTALIESMDRVEELEWALKEFDRYSLVIESAVRTCDPIRRPEVLAALRAARKSLGGSNER
jgi:hypothetical protein